MARDRTFQIRLSEEEFTLWRKGADILGVTLANYFRISANWLALDPSVAALPHDGPEAASLMIDMQALTPHFVPADRMRQKLTTSGWNSLSASSALAAST